MAQLVEHRTGIAEVTGSNPVKALILSGFFFPIAQIGKFTAMIILHFGQINCSKSVFLQTKSTHFETMVTTVNESAAIKQRYEFIFRSVSRVCFIAEIKE